MDLQSRAVVEWIQIRRVLQEVVDVSQWDDLPKETSKEEARDRLAALFLLAVNAAKFQVEDAHFKQRVLKHFGNLQQNWNTYDTDGVRRRATRICMIRAARIAVEAAIADPKSTSNVVTEDHMKIAADAIKGMLTRAANMHGLPPDDPKALGLAC